MAVNITVEANINIPKNLAKINNDTFWRYAASEWHRLYSPFVPMQTGNLMEDVTIKPKEINHNAPYAKKLYNSNFNFRKDKHPMASGKWDKAAIPTQGEKLINSMQAYADSGKLELRK